MFKLCSGLLMALTLVGVSAAWGGDKPSTILYQDGFTGSSAQPLNGTSPPTDIGGGKWTAGSGWRANGATAGGHGFQTALLPFKPVGGKIYAVSATLNARARGGNWLAVGFCGPTGFFKGVGPWMLLSGNGGIQIFSGPGTLHGTAAHGTFRGPQHLEVLLNTRGHRWTAQWFDNGHPLEIPGGATPADTTYSYTHNPMKIATVGIGTNDEPGTAKNFLFFSGLKKIATLGTPAAWIWAKRLVQRQWVYFRKSIMLTAVPAKFRLFVAADDRFTLFINGKRVARSGFVRSDTTGWKVAQSVDVAKYLKSGKNTFGLKAASTGRRAGVVLWLVSGKKIVLKTDGSWRVATRVSPHWATSAAGANRKPAAGKIAKFPFPRERISPQAVVRRAWKSATVESAYGGGLWGDKVAPCPMRPSSYLEHRYFPPVKVAVLCDRAAFHGLRTLSGKGPVHLVVEPAAGGGPAPELLLDFGHEVTGRMQVRGRGGWVFIGTGESPGEALHAPWRGWHRLHLVPGQTQSTPYTGFRYVDVRFRKSIPFNPRVGPITLNRLRLDFRYYPVQYRGAFSCSDPLLTKIWYTGAYTVHLCMTKGGISASAKRAPDVWMGDLQIMGQVVNDVFLDRFLMEKSLTLLRRNAQGSHPPTALPTNYVNGLPGYSDAWICALSDFYRHSGAIGYLRSQRELLLSMLRYIKLGFNRKNLFVNKLNKWCFVDWAVDLNNGDSPQANEYIDMFTCMAVRRAVFLLKVLGDTTDARNYATWDRQLFQAARQYLPNAKTHTFTRLRQVNAMAVYSGVADAAQRRAIYQRIFSPQSPAWKWVATPYGNNFVLDALGDMGHIQQALNFIRYYWGGMIHEGATTFWEAYDPSWPKKHFHRYLWADNREGYFTSLCHGWSAGVTHWLTRYVLGVRPMAAGFSRTLVVPHLGGLFWAAGRVPTPHGNIVLKVEKNLQGETLNLTLPPGVQASVGIPGTTVRVNGKAFETSGHHAGRVYVMLKEPGHYVILSH